MAGCGKSPEKTQECLVEYAFGEMSNDCPRNTIKNPVWDDNYWVRTGGGRATWQSM